MKNLDFDVVKEDVFHTLKNNLSIVLATSCNNRVTAREVYFASNGFTIYFVTSKAYEKYKQIEKNSNVALCINNIQMEGVASIKGHPNQPENKDALNICINKNKEAFERYVKHKNTVLIEILVRRVEIWKNNGREYLDIEKSEAYRIGK